MTRARITGLIGRLYGCINHWEITYENYHGFPDTGHTHKTHLLHYTMCTHASGMLRYNRTVPILWMFCTIHIHTRIELTLRDSVKIRPTKRQRSFCSVKRCRALSLLNPYVRAYSKMNCHYKYVTVVRTCNKIFVHFILLQRLHRLIWILPVHQYPFLCIILFC